MRMTGKALWRRLEATSSEERARRNHVTLTKRILDASPYDELVSSRDIASRVEVSSHEVGAQIGHRLLYEHVERRPQRKPGWCVLLYPAPRPRG